MLDGRARQEQALVEELDKEPRFRQGRLRDVVNARELNIELGDVVTRAAMAMNTSIGQLVDHDRTRLRAFTDCMPSTRVAVTLKAAYHKNNQHTWTTNDIHDIDALSIAVPYCDAVLTDKAARNQLVSSPELDVFNTFMPRKPEQLAQWLDEL